MRLHDDPISSLALTPRRQTPAMAALPWTEDERRYVRQIVFSLAAAAVLSALAVLFA